MNKHNDFFDAVTYTFKEVDRIKKRFADLPIQPLNLKPEEKSFDYYKGFYDATHQFMQTFEKLIETGALSETKRRQNGLV